MGDFNIKLGVVGAGQLCRMFGEEIANKNLNISLYALDPQENPPAKKYLKKLIVGDFKNEKMILELANEVDLVTFEIELANLNGLKIIEDRGKKVFPSYKVLQNIQDKYEQYIFLKKNNLPLPESTEINKKSDLEKFIKKNRLPVVVKSRKDSYDGRGNFIVNKNDELDKVFSFFRNSKLMVQEFINFSFEISVIGCRELNGKIITFPLAVNFHGKKYNILDRTYVFNMEGIIDYKIEHNNLEILENKNHLIEIINIYNFLKNNKNLIERANNIAKDVLKAYDTYGVMVVEMMIKGNDIYINEIAPRVHNSGHYSIEGCNVSQFEAHLKAITGKSIEKPNLKSDSVVMLNIYGGENDRGNYEIIFKNENMEQKIIDTIEVEKGVYFHNYMKEEVRPYRKIGHVTILKREDESFISFLNRIEKIKENIYINKW